MADYVTRTGQVYPASGTQLSIWARNVRSRYHNGRLPPEQAAQLEALPGWTWRVRKRRRYVGLARGLPAVIAATKRVGGPLSQTNTDPQTLRISRMIRRYHRAGRLPSWAVARMEATPGWVWTKTGLRSQRWADRIPELEAFFKEHGHFPSASSKSQAERRLSNWWYRRARATMTPAEAACARWWAETAKIPYKWLQLYQDVTRMLAEPAAIDYRRAWDLRSWVMRQRGRAAAGKLSDRQREMLATIVLPDMPARPVRVPTITDPAALAARQAENTARMLRANAERSSTAAERTVQLARAALARPFVPSSYRAILQTRVDHPADNLAQLAGRIGLTKHAYSGQLRRALASTRR